MNALLDLWTTLEFCLNYEWHWSSAFVSETNAQHLWMTLVCYILWMMPAFCISEWLWHLWIQSGTDVLRFWWDITNTDWVLVPCPHSTTSRYWQTMNKLCFLIADCLPDRWFYGAEQQRHFIFLFFVLCFESQNNKVFGVTKKKKRERERENTVLWTICQTYSIFSVKLSVMGIIKP